MTYRSKRIITYSIIALVVFILPFIQINGNQIFLLSFAHGELHLFGVKFGIEEFYLMPFLIMMLFIGMFFITATFGRLWCGWGCPQTIFRTIYRDLIETHILKLHKKTSNKQKPINYNKKYNRLKKIVGILMFAIIAMIASANFLFYFIPPAEFFAYILDFSNHLTFILFWFGFFAILMILVTKLEENFCIYICPYGRIQSILYDKDTLNAVYDTTRGGNIYDEHGKNKLIFKANPDECILCNKCVQVCPTHIDKRAGMQLECIECLECVDACTSVMGNLGKDSLISWSSNEAVKTKTKIKFIRAKTIGYVIVLSAIFIFTLFMASKKESIVLSVHKTPEMYKIAKNNMIENNYIFILRNSDNKDHKYYFKIQPQNITIKRPKKVFALKAGKTVKKITILQSPKANNSGTKDINIIAYTTDDNQSITIKDIFIYPQD